MRLAALGRTGWLHDAVLRLAADGHEIVLVGTAPAAPEYRVDESGFERLAERLECPFFCDADLSAHASAIEAAAPELGVSVNWPTVVPAGLLELFPRGILNGHVGDLPRFRGNAAPNWAILLGEKHVVVTVHVMEAGLDSGPVVARRAFRLGADTYIADVYAFLDDVFPELFADAVAGLEQGTARLEPQPDEPELSLRCHPRLPRDGGLQWDRPAEELARVVRTSAEPFAGAFSWLGDEKVTVWRAHAEELAIPAIGVPGHVIEVRRSEGHAAILTGSGVLVLEEVEFGGRRAPASELIGSTRLRLGFDVEALVARVRRLEDELRR